MTKYLIHVREQLLYPTEAHVRAAKIGAWNNFRADFIGASPSNDIIARQLHKPRLNITFFNGR
jgi:hypothetical protein